MPAKEKSVQAKLKAAVRPEVEHSTNPWLGFAIAILVVIIATGGYAMLWGGVRIAGVRVSDASAQQKISEKISDYKKETLTFTADGSTYQVSVASLDPTFDIPASIKAAKQDKDIWHSFFGHQAQLSASYDQNSWAQTILGWSSSVDTPVSNAAVSVLGGTPTLMPARTGTRLDFGVTSERLTTTLGALKSGPTPLATYHQAPLVSDAQLRTAWPKVKTWLSGPLTLTPPSGDPQQLSVAQIAKLVTVSSSEGESELIAPSSDLASIPLQTTLTSVESFAQPTDSVATLDQTALQSVADEIAPQYYVAPLDAQLAWQNGGLTVTAPSQTGRQLDDATFIGRLKTALTSKDRTVELPITIAQPAVSEDNIASLGITQLIGRGTSNWGISPVDRIHNIMTGISHFKSVLVPPGTNFSFNKILGNVDASTGYLPELSILADKTVPEFGGGLCQVSTTAWRAALNAGLPIVSRTNHAYPVSYYYPIGTDATIYLPYPDMSWKNNTGHYILIQAYTQKNNVFFDYYGTLPQGEQVTFARNASMSGAVNDVVKLPNYVYDVKPDGSEDTIFYRQVIINGQVQRTDHFFTHYQSAKLFPDVAQ
jgi:vancomycin resistance protein YoaR